MGKSTCFLSMRTWAQSTEIIWGPLVSTQVQHDHALPHTHTHTCVQWIFPLLVCEPIIGKDRVLKKNRGENNHIYHIWNHFAKKHSITHIKKSTPINWPWTTEKHFLLEAGMMCTAETSCHLIVNRQFWGTQPTKTATLWLQWIYKKEISVQMSTGKVQCCTTTRVITYAYLSYDQWKLCQMNLRFHRNY